MASWYKCNVLLLLLLLAVAGAAAVRPDAQAATISLATSIAASAASPAIDEAQPATRSLMTYFLSASKPQLQLNSAGATRTDRTALTVTLLQQAVSPWMPAVSPRPDGMTHDVLNTWTALKNYALVFSRVNAVNSQAAPGATRLFPRACVAARAASDVSPFGKLDVGRIIDNAEAHNQRSTWTDPFPGSVLLLPHGSSTAAVADVMDITHDEQAGTITLHLELVHSPETISEFDAHGKQTLDVREAHYHFSTSPGVVIDAARLLAALQDANFEVAGLHMFVKGPTCEVFNFVASITSPADGTHVAVGDTVQVDFAVVGEDPGCGKRSDGVVGRGSCAPTGILTLNVTGPASIPSTSVNTVSGQGNVYVLVEGPGDITVTCTIFTSDAQPLQPCPLPGPTLTLTGGGGAEVALLAIGPHKAHRHVHEYAAITAVAFDSARQPVAGAVVTFAFYDDAHDSYSHRSNVGQRSVTTDAQGRARVDIPSRHPDAVTVVAAVRNSSGRTVVSRPARIVWTDDDYEREEEHYERYRSADDYYAA